jgi:uncharacterized protein (UPF0262 family)
VIKRVRIDDALWDAAHRKRRDDWRVSIADLVDEERLGREDDRLLLISLTQNAVELATFDDNGAPRELLEIERAHLREHIEEYLAIIRRIESADENNASAVMHSLDMGKKVVHDAGARTLARLLPSFARDHEAYRRLFSLILAVVVDVTTLPGARGHGPPAKR